MEYKAAFDILDIDKDDVINKAEFRHALGAAFTLFDPDLDGKFTRVEFIAGFQIFDTDHDGLRGALGLPEALRPSSGGLLRTALPAGTALALPPEATERASRRLYCNPLILPDRCTACA